jgi:hypothetical protein
MVMMSPFRSSAVACAAPFGTATTNRFTVAPPTVFAFPAVVAVVANVANAAVSAALAAGTLARLDSSTSAPVKALFLTLGLVTAFFFSCFAPTLFLGSLIAA